MTQDVIGGGVVEIEVGKREIEKIGHAVEGQGFAAALQLDRSVFGPFEIFPIELTEKAAGLVESLLKLGKCPFVVFVARNVLAGEAGCRTLRGVADDLHLSAERQHVGGKTVVQDGFRSDVALARPALRLGKDAGEILELTNENRNGDRKHADAVHLDPFSFDRMSRLTGVAAP